MPQMSPMWWMALFAMISFTFIVIFIIIYFISSFQKLKTLIKSVKLKKSYSWKW